MPSRYASPSGKEILIQNRSHHHPTHHDHHGSTAPAQSLSRVASSATVHCLTDYAIGEVLSMVIGTALGWGASATIALAVALAFPFGYALTMLPLLDIGMTFGTASGLAFALPLNHWLIARGRGYALVYAHH